MIRSKTAFLLSGFVLGSFVIATPARADSLTQTLSTGDLQATFNSTLTFNAFDPSLGTLNSVSIRGEVTSQANVDILNTSGAPQSFQDGSAVFPITLSSPTGDQTSVSASTTGVSGTVGPAFAVTDFPGTQTIQSFTPIDVPAGLLGSYSGGPGTTFGVTFAASNGTYHVQGNVAVGGSLSASSSVTVDYEYTPVAAVPSPAPAAPIVGLAAAGLCVTARRRGRIAI